MREERLKALQAEIARREGSINSNESISGKYTPIPESGIPSSKKQVGSDKTSGTRYLEQFGKNASVGALSAIPNLGALILNTPSYIKKGIGHINGNEAWKNEEAPIPYLSDIINNQINQATDNYFEPRNFGERAAGTIGELLAGGGVTSLATKGAKIGKFLAPQTAKDYAGLAGAGAGLESAKEAVPESGVVALLGALLGGLVPGAALGAGKAAIRGLTSNKQGVNAFQKVAGEPFKSKGEHVAPAMTRLTETAIDERQPIESAYQKATGHAAKLPQSKFENFSNNIAKKLEEESIHPESSNEIYGLFKSVEKATSGKKVSINRLEKTRQIINNRIERAEEHGTTARELRKLKGAFDEELDDVIETALSKSEDPKYAEVLSDFKKARSLNTEWHKKYSTDNPEEYGKSFVSKMIERARNVPDEKLTPETVVNRILGTSELGFSNKAPYIVDELAKHLTPKEMQSIKTETLGRIFKPINLENPTTAQLTKFKTNWDKFKTENKSLMNKMLDKSEINVINDFVKNNDIKTNPGRFRNELKELPFGRLVEYALDTTVNRAKEIPSLLTQSTVKAFENPRNDKTPKEAPGENILEKTLQEIENPPEEVSEEAPPQQNDRQQRLDALREEIKRREEESANPQSGLLNKIAQVESGGNPNARSKTSSASGLLQFTNSTWKEGVNRYGEEEGVSLRDKNNPDAQRKIANRLLSDNSKELEKFLGRKPKDAEIYMTHFLGLGGTKKLLKSNDKRVAAHIFPVEARANRNVFYKNGRPITIAELKSKINQMIS